MRITLALATVATLVAATSILSTPASATDKAGALKACGQNRNCGISGGSHGWVDLHIVQADGHTDYVTCPPKGACDCISCKTAGGGKGGKITPIKVITASSPKTPAKTGTTTRDHRGTTGAAEGGVTVNGKKTTVGQAPKPGNPKGKEGFAGVGAGATVRDHRK